MKFLRLFLRRDFVGNQLWFRLSLWRISSEHFSLRLQWWVFNNLSLSLDVSCYVKHVVIFYSLVNSNIFCTFSRWQAFFWMILNFCKLRKTAKKKLIKFSTMSTTCQKTLVCQKGNHTPCTVWHQSSSLSVWMFLVCWGRKDWGREKWGESCKAIVLFDYLRKTVNFMVCMKLLDIKRVLKSSLSAFSHY